MKRHIYIIIGLISVATVLFSSCSTDLSEDLITPTTGEDDGMVDVTVSFTVEDLENYTTRGDGEAGEKSTLKDIDLLVYALRDEKGNILKQYGKGIVDENLKNRPAIDGNYKETDDNNQTLMKVEWENKNGKYEMEEKITLRVMRGTVFKLSCWTQSSNHAAYDFNSLEDVKVDYTKMTINDESYDAFCATSIFSVGQVDANITVTLTRPFAQINVGVKEKEDATNNNYSEYTHSQITLNGVHTSFNVVKNEVNEGTKDEDVTLGYSPLSNTTLKVTTGLQETKTYQSLAMCYVLVPETSYKKDENGNIQDDATTNENSSTEDGVVSPAVTPSTLTLVSFSLAKDENGSEAKTYTPATDKAEISVKRNWRTNLLFEDWSWADQNSSSSTSKLIMNKQ